MRLFILVSIACGVLLTCAETNARSENSDKRSVKKSSKSAKSRNASEPGRQQQDRAAEFAETARMQLMNNNLALSLENSNKALKLDPNSMSALYCRWHVYIAKQAWKEALIDCQRYIDAGGARDEAALNDAYLLCKKLDRQVDADMYKKRRQNLMSSASASEVSTRTERRDQDPESLFMLEHLDKTKGSYKALKQKIGILDQRIKRAPHDEDARFGRASILFMNEEYKAALPDLIMLRKLHPEDSSLCMLCADSCFYLKQYKEAADEYAKVLTLKPKRSRFSIIWWPKDEIYVRRGECLMAAHLYDEAIKNYTDALTYEPDQDESLQKRGDCYVAKSQYDKALTDYTKAIALDPLRSSATYLKRATVYDKLMQPDKANADRARAKTTAVELERKNKELPAGTSQIFDVNSAYRLLRPAENSQRPRK